ncbi:MAG: AbrB/MazE/SpoVT family DNA-binding domain-containing protein [bacterium]
MSYPITAPTVTIQRDKNQITIPSVIAKQINAKKGTKYRVSVDKDGIITLKVIKNDIRKYLGIIKTDKSAVDIIREERLKDEQKILNFFK